MTFQRSTNAKKNKNLKILVRNNFINFAKAKIPENMSNSKDCLLLAGEEGGPATDQGSQEVPGEVSKPVGDGFPPTFTEKPRIVPNETGTLVSMKFKVVRTDVQRNRIYATNSDFVILIL